MQTTPITTPLGISHARPAVRWRRRRWAIPVIRLRAVRGTIAHLHARSGPLRRGLVPREDSPARAAAIETAGEAEEQKKAEHAGDGDDEGFVATDPAADFFEAVAALADAVRALAAAAALSPVQEVLLHAVAGTEAELGRGTGELAVDAVASVRVVLLRVGAHEGLALLISRCALAGSACQTQRAVAAGLTVGRSDVGGTDGGMAGAYLLRITGTSTRTANGVR